MSSSTVPQIFDTGKRVARTAIQTGIPAFIAFAGVLPQVLPILHVYVGPRLFAVLVGTAAGITAAAAVITRIMAIPAVNSFLSAVGLGGHSGSFTAADTHTSFIATIPVDAH